MPTLNARAVGTAYAALRQVNGVAGRYVRGNASVGVVCVPDTLASNEVTDDPTDAVSTLDQDWLIRPTDLVLDSQAVLPQRGDKWITKQATYEVVERAEPAVYRWTDESRTILRFFTTERRKGDGQ